MFCILVLLAAENIKYYFIMKNINIQTNIRGDEFNLNKIILKNRSELK